jgi:hypothetical protein
MQGSSCKLTTLAYICFELDVLKTFMHDPDQGTLWNHSLDVAFSNVCLVKEIECSMHESCNFIWNKYSIRLHLTNNLHSLRYKNLNNIAKRNL